jgi:hypothetical protein
MHRHLLGLDSPPASYIADAITQGPILPEGWDGDAWVDLGEREYFLRAWNKESGRVAYGRGSSYDEARRALLKDVAHGFRKVSTQEIGVG